MRKPPSGGFFCFLTPHTISLFVILSYSEESSKSDKRSSKTTMLIEEDASYLPMTSFVSQLS